MILLTPSTGIYFELDQTSCISCGECFKGIECEVDVWFTILDFGWVPFAELASPQSCRLIIYLFVCSGRSIEFLTYQAYRDLIKTYDQESLELNCPIWDLKILFSFTLRPFTFTAISRQFCAIQTLFTCSLVMSYCTPQMPFEWLLSKDNRAKRTRVIICR